MYTAHKRGAKIAKWLAEQKMREEQALIAEAMRRVAATETPRLLPLPAFDVSGAPLSEVSPRSGESGTPHITPLELRASLNSVPEFDAKQSTGDYENANKRMVSNASIGNTNRNESKASSRQGRDGDDFEDLDRDGLPDDLEGRISCRETTTYERQIAASDSFKAAVRDA